MNSHNNIQSKTVLVTGGTGYIGSHTFVALVAAGYTTVIFDDFSNSQFAVLERLECLTGQSVLCERGNVLDTSFVEQVLQPQGRAFGHQRKGSAAWLENNTTNMNETI